MYSYMSLKYLVITKCYENLENGTNNIHTPDDDDKAIPWTAVVLKLKVKNIDFRFFSNFGIRWKVFTKCAILNSNWNGVTLIKGKVTQRFHGNLIQVWSKSLLGFSLPFLVKIAHLILHLPPDSKIRKTLPQKTIPLKNERACTLIYIHYSSNQALACSIFSHDKIHKTAKPWTPLLLDMELVGILGKSQTNREIEISI